MASVEQALINGRTSRDEEGNVIELFGIMQMPARHRIQIGQVCLFSCCALVAQMVPLLLGRTTKIESVDPISNRLVTLDISPSGIQSVEPLSPVGTLVITKQEEVLADVRSAFCMHVHHFPDAESAQKFIALDSRRYLVTIQQLNEASRRLFDAIWGYIITPVPRENTRRSITASMSPPMTTTVSEIAAEEFGTGFSTAFSFITWRAAWRGWYTIRTLCPTRPPLPFAQRLYHDPFLLWSCRWAQMAQGKLVGNVWTPARPMGALAALITDERGSI